MTELREAQETVHQLNDTLSTLTQAVRDAESVEDIASTEAQLKQELAEQVEKQKQVQEQLKAAKEKLQQQSDENAANENVKTIRDLFANLSQSLAKQYQAEAYIRARENESDYSREKNQSVELLNGLQALINGPK